MQRAAFEGAQATIVVPLIAAIRPYNATETCVGFLTLKVTGVSTDNDHVSSVQGEIVKIALKGTNGAAYETGNQSVDQNLAALAPKSTSARLVR